MDPEYSQPQRPAEKEVREVPEKTPSSIHSTAMEHLHGPGWGCGQSSGQDQCPLTSPSVPGLTTGRIEMKPQPVHPPISCYSAQAPGQQRAIEKDAPLSLSSVSSLCLFVSV